MDYSALWVSADNMHRAADGIEAFIKSQEGEPAEPRKVDMPECAHTVWSDAAEAFGDRDDRGELYRRVEIAFQQARWTLLETSALEGSRVTTNHAHICRMAALRCREVLTELTKAGEL